VNGKLQSAIPEHIQRPIAHGLEQPWSHAVRHLDGESLFPDPAEQILNDLLGPLMGSHVGVRKIAKQTSVRSKDPLERLLVTKPKLFEPLLFRAFTGSRERVGESRNWHPASRYLPATNFSTRSLIFFSSSPFVAHGVRSRLDPSVGLPSAWIRVSTCALPFGPGCT